MERSPSSNYNSSTRSSTPPVHCDPHSWLDNPLDYNTEETTCLSPTNSSTDENCSAYEGDDEMNISWETSSNASCPTPMEQDQLINILANTTDQSDNTSQYGYETSSSGQLHSDNEDDYPDSYVPTDHDQSSDDTFIDMYDELIHPDITESDAEDIVRNERQMYIYNMTMIFVCVIVLLLTRQQQ